MRFGMMFRSLALILSIVLLSGLVTGCAREGEAEGKEDITVYFTRLDGEMVPVVKSVELEEATDEERLRKAVDILLEGPNEKEAKEGLSSEAQGAAPLNSISIERPYAVLDFGADLDHMGGSVRVSGFLKQIAYTASEIQGVKGVILKVDGEVRGSEENPFTGEGVLFRNLHRPLEDEWLSRLGPADVLDLFIVTIPETPLMWHLMGPDARQMFGDHQGIEWSAFAEGLGSWRDYRVEEEVIDNDTARVTIVGDVEREGMAEKDARYTARMVKVDGIWRWDYPRQDSETSGVPFQLISDEYSSRELEGLPKYFLASGWLDEKRLFGSTGNTPVILNLEEGGVSTLDQEAWWSRPSPQGTHVICHNADGLFLLELPGGEKKRLVEKADEALFSPEMNSLLYWFIEEWNSQCHLYTMADGATRPLDTSYEGYFLTFPVAWLDETQVILNTRASAKKDGTGGYSHGYRGDILLLNIDTDEKRLLTDAEDGTFYQAIGVVEGNLIAYTSTRDNIQTLGLIDLNGKVKTLAEGTASSLFYVSPSGSSWSEVRLEDSLHGNTPGKIFLASAGENPREWGRVNIGDHFSGLLWSPSERQVAISLETRMPGEVPDTFSTEYHTYIAGRD